MENFKLKHLSSKCSIDKENKVVVCKATFIAFSDEIFMTTGIAMAKNEEFDEEIGVKLAKARAEKEAFIKYSEILKGMIKEETRYLNSLEFSLESNIKNLEHQKEYIRTFKEEGI